MREGKVSNTAQFVAYNRALANLSPQVPGFSDPIAEQFLSDGRKRKIEQMRTKVVANPSKSPIPFWFRGMGIYNQFRTVVLDKAIRSATPFSQLVILGAGLDSRAWRIKELESVTVFEVDYPATQNFKQEKTVGLKPLAKEVRFVPMDFTKDDLASKLQAAGYDKSQKTFWLWEGVTMYLTPELVAQNMSSMASLSSSDSRLAFTYMERKNGKIPSSWFLALLGEPARSAFSLDELDRMASGTGWKTISNTGITNWKQELTPNLTLTERSVGLQWHERIWIGKV